MRQTAPRRDVRARAFALTAAVVVALAAHALAQDGGVVARYPDAAKVAADYADDAERYMALKVLFDDIGAKTKGVHEPGAYAKGSAYFDAFQQVAAKYMSVKRDAPEHVAYSERLNRLFQDAAFRRAVIAKYGLADIPTPRAGAAAAAPASGDVTDEMIQAAFLRGLPFVVAGLAGMWFACRALLRNSVASPSGRDAPMPPPTGVPAMPESLRVVRLPGVEYPVETSCGIVIDKETTVATTAQTTTTGGGVHTVGDQVHYTAPTTQTTISSVQTDLIWVRTPEGREESWSFTGGTFKARRGQIVTLITRPLADGSSDRLIAYNHATDQFEEFGGVARAHGASPHAAWWASFAIGCAGFGIAVAILVSIGPDPIQGVVGWISVSLVSTVPAAVAAFVVEGVVHRGVAKRRRARFTDEYVPGFRRFLEQATPALQTRLGA